MRQLLDDFLLDGSERVGWTAATVLAYRSHVAGLLSWLTARHGRAPEVGDYTADLIQTYDTSRKRAGTRQRSRAAALCAWQSFARWLAERRHIPEAECAAIAKLHVRITEKPRQRWATAAQVIDLFAACERVGDYHGETLAYRPALCAGVLAVMAYGGLRRAEVVDLKLADIRLDAQPPSMTIRGKGEKYREVWLHAGAVRHLRRWLEVRPVGGDALFTVPVYHHGRAATSAAITRFRVVGILSELCEMAEIPTDVALTPHSFRRFAASNLLKVPGCTLKHVQEFLGHSHLATTMEYCGTEVLELQQFVAAMVVEAPADPEPPLRIVTSPPPPEKLSESRRRAVYRREA